MTGALQDLRLGLRGLWRSPGFLLSAVACFALGIGVNATMLKFLDLVLFQPPAHVRDAKNVVRLSYRQPGGGLPQGVFSYPAYADLANGSHAFSAMAAYAYDLSGGSSLGSGAAAQRVRLELVTPSFFSLLGVQPSRGRLFSEAEGDPERPGLVALVSWEFWQRAFGGAGILGWRLPIGQQSYTVVGVLPPRFTGVDLEPVDLWLPAGALRFLGAGPGWSQDRGRYMWSVIGRLRPGVSVRQARLQATLAYQQAYAALGDRHAAERSIALAPVQLGWSPEGGRAARLAAWSAGAGMAVFLTACSSVAGLLLLRSLDRRRELAVRLALGASRAGLARLLMGESLLLALLGGAAALAVAWMSKILLGAFFLPGGFPDAGSGDVRTLAILGVLVLGAALLSGVGPALWALRKGSPAPVLGGGRELDRGRSRLRPVLLAVQVAFAFVLLVGAGLFTRSLSNARGLRLGLDPDRVLMVTTDLAAAGYSPARVDAFYRLMLERVRGLPGVERATVAAAIPFNVSFGAQITIPGRGFLSPTAEGGPYMNAVADDYFATLGTRVRRGRPLTAEDGTGSERVGVVNETVAKLAWPGDDPLGRCFKMGDDTAPCTTVVGVVEDARRQGLEEGPTAQVYVPLAQAPPWVASRALFVRAAEVEPLRDGIRRAVQSLAPGVPFVEVRSLRELLDPQFRVWRTGATVFSMFGLLALAVATLGLFAAVGHAVASRSAELGVRKALGARFRDLLWTVMKSGLVPAAAGIAIGLAAAFFLGRLIEPLLFQVSIMDPVVITSAALALLGTALLASLLPALRVQAVDPAAVLRVE